MSANDQAIVTMYEDLGLSVEDISKSEGWDVISIKACLMQNSVQFREELKLGKVEGFTEQDDIDATRVIRDLMHNAEDETLRFRCATRVKDEKKGRLDKVKVSDLRGANITVVQFNDTIQKAKAARLRALGMVDITPSSIPESASVVKEEVNSGQ